MKPSLNYTVRGGIFSRVTGPRTQFEGPAASHRSTSICVQRGYHRPSFWEKPRKAGECKECTEVLREEERSLIDPFASCTNWSPFELWDPLAFRWSCLHPTEDKVIARSKESCRVCGTFLQFCADCNVKFCSNSCRLSRFW